MASRVGNHVDDNALAPLGSRFALSPPEGLSGNAEPPSAARPFGLRFARSLGRSDASWPAHRYCHDRQMLVTADGEADSLLVSSLGWEPTTLAEKDGQGRPQEDWKPDMPFSATP